MTLEPAQLGQGIGYKGCILKVEMGTICKKITWDMYFKWEFIGPGPDLWKENLCVKGPGLYILTDFLDGFMYAKVWETLPPKICLFDWQHSGDTRDAGSVPVWGTSPGEGNGKPLHYSCLENFTDRGTWRATVHGGHKELDMTEHECTCMHAYTHAHTHTHILHSPIGGSSLRKEAPILGWGDLKECRVKWDSIALLKVKVSLGHLRVKGLCV